jgi:hypothetical protein
MEKHFTIEKPVAKNKFFEFEVGVWDNPNRSILNQMFSITTKGDHAGFNLYVEILGAYMTVCFYDTRHWNYEKNRWYTEEDYEELAKDFAKDVKSKRKTKKRK